MGHCISHKDPTVSKKRRLAYEAELRQAVKLEEKDNIDWGQVTQDPLSGIFDSWIDYEMWLDALRHPEYEDDYYY